MKYLLIVNPISGRGHAEKVIPTIEAKMHRQGLTFETVRTERPWHAAELAEQAAKDNKERCPPIAMARRCAKMEWNSRSK